MNLQELLDSSSPEDRQTIIDHFILSIQGRADNTPLILRKVIKLSTLSNEEDLKKQISTICDIPIDKLKHINIQEGINIANVNYNNVERLIEPYKNYLISLKSRKDKFEELYDIGKFLLTLHQTYSIVVPKEVLPYPDFIIEGNQRFIGIEHTRLLNSEIQERFRNINQILKIAEKDLQSKKENFTQIINITLNYQTEVLNRKTLSSSLTRIEKESIAKSTSNWIYSQFINVNIPKPDFIDKIEISLDSVHPLSINLVEKYIAKAEVEKLLTERLSAKEGKFNKYSSIKDFDEIWLIIVFNGATKASGFIIEDNELINKIKSMFTKIFLFDSFSNNLLLIYSSI